MRINSRTKVKDENLGRKQLHFVTWGRAITEDSSSAGPVTVNWQLESGNPLLPSYEQLPPVDLWFAKYDYFVNTFSSFLSFIVPSTFRSVQRAGCMLILQASVKSKNAFKCKIMLRLARVKILSLSLCSCSSYSGPVAVHIC